MTLRLRRDIFGELYGRGVRGGPSRPVGKLAAGSYIVLPAGTVIGFNAPEERNHPGRWRLSEETIARLHAGDTAFYSRGDGTYDFGAEQPELFIYDRDQRGATVLIPIRMYQPDTGEYDTADAGDPAFIWTSSDPWTIETAEAGTVMPDESSGGGDGQDNTDQSSQGSEPGLSTGEKVAIGVGVVGVGALLWWALS